MSDFSEALATAINVVHAAEGSPAVEYRPTAGAPFALVAVWDARGTVLDLASGVLQRTGEPQLGVALADFPAPPVVGDEVAVTGVAYRVADIDPDGQGGATLHLRRL